MLAHPMTYIEIHNTDAKTYFAVFNRQLGTKINLNFTEHLYKTLLLDNLQFGYIVQVQQFFIQIERG